MSFTKSRTRRLGSLRHSTSSLDTTIPKFPPLTLKEKNSLNGIQGNAMAVPPPRESPERLDKGPTPRTFTAKSEVSNKSEESNDTKELKEALAREQQLKKQIVTLNRITEEQRASIQEKNTIIADLRPQIAATEEKWRALYEEEVESHSITKQTLGEVQGVVDELTLNIESLKGDHENAMSRLRIDTEQRVQQIMQEKNKEIAEKDEKLNRLKKQIADTLKGNSWERQQQLDELTKELTKVQEEADTMRAKIRSFTRATAKGECGNCDNLSTQLNSANKIAKDKDKMIKDLQSLCEKFEKQLSQQDHLLKQFAESKGHKVSDFPK